MELLGILEMVARPLAVAVALYAVYAFRRGHGLLLAAAILLIASYNLAPLAGEEGTEAWLRHVPVYVGLLFLLMFLRSFAGPAPRGHGSPPRSAAAAVAGAPGLSGWFRLLTDNGLQHIIMLPLFAAVLVATIVRSADAPAELKAPLKYVLWAGAAATLIHVMEFVVESQGLIPALEGTGVEVLETVLVYKMLLWFALGIRSGHAVMRPAR